MPPRPPHDLNACTIAASAWRQPTVSLRMGGCGRGATVGTVRPVAGAAGGGPRGIVYRLRYMGSKFKLIPTLAEVFAELGGRTALDAFSGSGVVAYTLKALGCRVTTNDFLRFPGVIAQATMETRPAS